MKRFYTLPEFNYPYVLIPFHHNECLKRVRFKHAIMDSGVQIFAHGAKEYPPSFFGQYEFKCQQLTQIFNDRLWCVIPDYPDDYAGCPIEHNVSRTLHNIRVFSKIEGVNWVYPVQSDYMNMQSLHDSCHELMKFHPDRVGIGTVCKAKNIEYIEACCRMIRQHFYLAYIHAFGPTLTALPRILPYIDSFDSSAWTFPRQHGGHSCKNQDERHKYFDAYLQRVNELLTDFHSQTRLGEEREEGEQTK